MKICYVLANPDISGIVKKQSRINTRLAVGLALAMGAMLMAGNQIITQQNRIAQLENRIRELECEKTD